MTISDPKHDIGDRPPRRVLSVLGAPIDVLSWTEAVERISNWAQTGESRYVCICNAHSVVTASKCPEFHRAIASADMATPDGAPVAWMLRRLGARGQGRISGPDLMLRYLAEAAGRGEPLFLYGSQVDTLVQLKSRLLRRWPSLNIVGAWSPPFRVLSSEEEDDIVSRINESGARTVWVSLGCPKQELWMFNVRDRVRAVMIGVGAAFDFHAGTVARAPQWMQRLGLEWLHRLASEPQRLWRRYLFTNAVFVAGACRQLMK
jgi:N-acetylglucosaminyldiphosphoundecaprenol N-acetyl-beta-D-mannosaminyltransferase